jgi:hypothetical protein
MENSKPRGQYCCIWVNQSVQTFHFGFEHLTTPQVMSQVMFLVINICDWHQGFLPSDSLSEILFNHSHCFCNLCQWIVCGLSVCIFLTRKIKAVIKLEPLSASEWGL